MSPEDRAAVIALTSIDGIGRSRLRRAIAEGPREAWEQWRSRAATRGELGAAGSTIDPTALAARHRRAGVAVTVVGDAAHPVGHGRVRVPPVLFWRGAGVDPDETDSVAALAADPRAAVVGTRRPTRYGLDVAQRLGRHLADHGISVVSGLAMGIDAAAHSGALATSGAAPIAVVASGVDRVHPRRNALLWSQVAERGVIVSEYPLGTPPAPWRFPERNRIVVALSSAVVVVESHERGGSLITASLAGEAGVPVLAVPGPVTSPSSLGTNKLLVDGCTPCLDHRDVVCALGLHTIDDSSVPDAGQLSLPPAGLDGPCLAVWEAIGWDGSEPSRIITATGLGVAEVSVALVRLQELGAVAAERGAFVRTAP